MLTLDPHSLDEVLETILAVGRRAGAAGRASELVARLRARLSQVAARVAGRPRPKVAVVEWVDPPFTAGHWVPDLVSAAGGQPVAARRRADAVATSWQAIAAEGLIGGVEALASVFHPDAVPAAPPPLRPVLRAAGEADTRGSPSAHLPPDVAVPRRVSA